MKCTAVPLSHRLIYGLLAREGLRLSEAQELDWTDLDLQRGVIHLDENKTDDPRSWMLDAGVVEAFRRWREERRQLSRPFVDVSERHAAERFRELHLRLAGIDRPELFASTDARKPVRVHDLRATFVTVSLANGKTETWVQDRTGHRSTLMIARYRRAARTLAELALGPLARLSDAIDWNESCQTGVKLASFSAAANGHPHPRLSHSNYSKRMTCGPFGGRTRTPSRAADFKSAASADSAKGPGDSWGNPWGKSPCGRM